MTNADVAGSREGQKVTWVGAGANALLVGVKFVLGFFGHSQALIADAVHSVSDLATDAVVLLGIRAGRKAPDQDHHFGHARIETLASAIVGIALIAVAAFLAYDAGSNIYRHTEYHPTWLASIGAAVSIVVKEILYHYTARAGRRIKSPVVMANAWHHRSDALSSVAVLAGVTAAQINPDWHILDSYAALVVSLLIAGVGAQILWRAVKEVTDTAPPRSVLENMSACARGVEGVIDEHDLKVRSSGGTYHLHIHITVKGDLTVREGHAIAKEVERRLLTDIENVGEVIVHVDPE
jgi:cation diffusion facilitator family transporter